MFIKKIARTCMSAMVVPVVAMAANAQEERIAYEGDRITGGLYLGMTRADVLNVSQSNNCAERDICTFRLPTVETRTLVELTLSNDEVAVIRLLSGGYTSTRGATTEMDPYDVAELYNTHVTRFTRLGQSTRLLVDVPELGYTFDTVEQCFRSQCVFIGEHVIYAPSGGSNSTPTPVGTPVPMPTQTPTPPPSNSGYSFIEHKPTGFRFYSCSDVDQIPVLANSTSDTSDCAQWTQVQAGAYFHLQNKMSGKYIRPSTAASGADIIIRPNTWTGNWTQWSYDDRGDGYGHLVNRATGKYVYVSGNNPEGNITQQPSSWRGNYTRWRFTPVD